MVVVPVVKPSTSPVDETVATAGAEDVHALDEAGLVVAESCRVFPAPTLVSPEITGKAVTVTVNATRSLSQPVAFT